MRLTFGLNYELLRDRVLEFVCLCFSSLPGIVSDSDEREAGHQGPRETVAHLSRLSGPVFGDRRGEACDGERTTATCISAAVQAAVEPRAADPGRQGGQQDLAVASLSGLCALLGSSSLVFCIQACADAPTWISVLSALDFSTAFLSLVSALLAAACKLMRMAVTQLRVHGRPSFRVPSTRSTICFSLIRRGATSCTPLSIHSSLDCLAYVCTAFSSTLLQRCLFAPSFRLPVYIYIVLSFSVAFTRHSYSTNVKSFVC